MSGTISRVYPLSFSIFFRWRYAAKELPLTHGCGAVPLESAVCGDILAAAHEQSEPKIFLVELIRRIKYIERRDDLCYRIFERLRDQALIHRVAVGFCLNIGAGFSEVHRVFVYN